MRVMAMEPEEIDEEPCERVLSQEEMLAFLGKTYSPEEYVSRKVLLLRYPDKEAISLRDRRTDQQVYRDQKSGMWMVEFYTENTFGGSQEVYMDGNGITHMIVYSE